MIFSIIVTYNPNIPQLEKCISSLVSQVEKIIIVKNSGESLDFTGFPFEKIAQLQLDENRGVAYAQNRGIEKAVECGAEWILLCDQDTVFPDLYVHRMMEKTSRWGNAVIYVPAFFNEIKSRMEAVSITFSENVRPAGTQPIPLIHAIASGSVFHNSVFQKTGGMDEWLFIDYVDFEFCWRARSAGIKTMLFPDIVIHHRLGDSCKIVFGRKITLRSDMRYYYMLRNGFYLSKKCHSLSHRERRALWKRTVVFAVGIILVSKNKVNAIRLVKKALVDSRHRRLCK